MRPQESRVSREEKLLEGLSKILQDLRMRSDEGTPIIVEGRNDAASLKELGINGKVLKIKGCNMSLYDFIYSLGSEEEAIILTDFDREGDEIAAELTKELTRIGVKADNHLRRKIKGLIKREVVGVEDLPNYLERLTLEGGLKMGHEPRIFMEAHHGSKKHPQDLIK